MLMNRAETDESGVGVLAQCAQRGIQLDQRRANELYAPVCSGQKVQNLAVKNKDAMHLLALGERPVKRCMVVGAQVAAEPDESGCVGRLGGGRHVHR
jgi:hypothetical protein